MNKKILLQLIIIIIVSAFSAVLFNAISGSGIDLIYQPAEFQEGAILTLEQAQRLYDQGNVLFIDARYPEEYNQAHIPGAVNLPANTSRDQMMNIMAPIAKDRPIVVYCSDPSCHASRRLAGFLKFIGYQHVHVYLNGFAEWQKHNLPQEAQK
jgi:rhodanese-related sulfurtransferase